MANFGFNICYNVDVHVSVCAHARVCVHPIKFRFCISNKLLEEVHVAGPWITLMSRRDLQDEL